MSVNFKVLDMLKKAILPKNELDNTLLDSSRYRLLYSTGKFDMNGVEIFEGDIIKNAPGTLNNDNTQGGIPDNYFNGYIIRRGETFYLVYKYYGYEQEEEFVYQANSMRGLPKILVVGNIYTNKRR